jgi:formylglycine-generating enzyme
MAWMRACVLLLATLVGCSSSDFQVAGNDAESSDSGGVETQGDDTSLNEAAPPMDSGAPETTTPPCPTRLPKMVLVDKYCIDSTEVTRDQYRGFLADVTALPSFTALQTKTATLGCTFAAPSELTPTKEWVATGDTRGGHPVAYVSWCHAVAYCAWAGKRLCGAIGGGALAVESKNDPSKSEWYRACTHAGERTYPYGVGYADGACNIGGKPGTVPVASMAACVGGYDGIFDLIGNVAEWENAKSTIYYSVRGAEFTGTPPDNCQWAHGIDETSANAGSAVVGIRCCADAL